MALYLQEFRRLCKVHGLRVIDVPLSQHDDMYRCDDIEIWKIVVEEECGGESIRDISCKESSRIMASLVEETLPLTMKNRLQFEPFEESQTEIDFSVVTAPGENIKVTISQSVSNLIGCRVWASAILTSR